jgi:hypothetical protein
MGFRDLCKGKKNLKKYNLDFYVYVEKLML